MPDDLDITARITIPAAELSFEYMRSGGPGGQHANKTDTAVRLRFDVHNTRAIVGATRERLIRNNANRINSDGELIIEASEYKSRTMNIEAARERLADMVKAALIVPKKRRKTKPSKGAKRRRLDAKKQRGQIKKGRGKVRWD